MTEHDLANFEPPPRRVLTLLFEEACEILRELSRPGLYDIEGARGRAVSALRALDSTLDFALGGQLASGLSRVYRGAANALEQASEAELPELADGIERLIHGLADSWAQLD